jgi:hypothetical protein
MLENMDEVMANAEARANKARKVLSGEQWVVGNELHLPLIAKT